MAEARAKQICALPEMVALILKLASSDINLREAELEARRIRKQIGEVE